MKAAVFSVAANFVALACVSSAAALALHDKEGWGWFLLVALFTAKAVRVK